MDDITAKYSRFCRLCNDIDKDNVWVIELQKTPFAIFFAAIKAEYHKTPNASVDSIYQDILTKSKIDISSVKTEKTERIKRYVDYFLNLVKIL